MNEVDLPAILGGQPVVPEGPPEWPRPDPAIEEALRAALSDGSWGRYHGPHVERLEAALAEQFQSAFVQTCASGTLAVETGLRALNVKPGDEVILAGYDYEPNFLSIHNLGAKPVLVDISADNATLDPAGLDSVRSAQTRAILVSHLHGGLAPMPAIVDWARLHGIAVLEDAAQVPGAMLAGKPAGSWGDIGILSFGGSKLLTAGRGGALLCQRADIHQRIRMLLHRGIQQWAPLAEIQAIVLSPQLARLSAETELRHQRVVELDAALADIPALRRFQNSGDHRSAYYKVGFWFDPEQAGMSRERFVAALRAEGIAFDVGFRALHIGRAPSRFRAGQPLDVARRAHEHVVILHHPILSQSGSSMQLVVRAIAKTLQSDVLRRPGILPGCRPETLS